MENYKYVIIGGGIAGGRACDGIRQLDEYGRAVLVTKEPHAPYEKPPLSKQFLRSEVDLDRVLLHDPGEYEQKKIDLITGVKASRLEPEKHTVILEDGRNLGYEKILLATGGKAKRLSLPGNDLDNVFTLRTIDDSKAIRAAAGKGKKALVLGGSFIGSEVAASLSQIGVDVTVIFPESRMLERIVPESLSAYLHELYKDRGVRVLPGNVAEKLLGNGKVQQALLENRDTLDVDLVVMGVGIELNTKLAEDAGLDLREQDQAVIVDEMLRTSDSQVYAAGDIAAWPDAAFGERLRVEHWDVARRQGLQAGRNMAGGNEAYDSLPYFFSDLFELSLEVWGDLSNWDRTIQRGEIKSGSFAFYYFSGGRMVGVLSVNRPDEERSSMQALVKAQPEFTDVKNRLADEDLNLSELVGEKKEKKMSETQQKEYSFQEDIRPLFRQKDIDEMKEISGFDLSNYEDVKEWASGIYARLADGSMPCDEPWSDKDLMIFKNWMEKDMPA